jgi:hypothetical protein
MAFPEVPMKRTFLAVVWTLLFANALCGAVPRAADATMHFTVSMAKPQSHCFHVRVVCRGLSGGTHDFIMPAWTPGYYLIMNHAKNVLDFRAADLAG